MCLLINAFYSLNEIDMGSQKTFAIFYFAMTFWFLLALKWNLSLRNDIKARWVWACLIFNLSKTHSKLDSISVERNRKHVRRKNEKLDSIIYNIKCLKVRKQRNLTFVTDTALITIHMVSNFCYMQFWYKYLRNNTLAVSF